MFWGSLNVEWTDKLSENYQSNIKDLKSQKEGQKPIMLTGEHGTLTNMADMNPHKIIIPSLEVRGTLNLFMRRRSCSRIVTARNSPL